MALLMIVFQRVLVLGFSAAAHVSACFAKPQMHPGVSKFNAVLAFVSVWTYIFDHVNMNAFAIHSP